MANGQRQVGVLAATLMVTGNIMGSGIYLLPANLAVTGGIAIYGWIVTLSGAIAIALVFAKWASFEESGGGAYAYARRAFGGFMGYKTNMVYWFQGWVGNVALAVVGIGYFSYFFPILREPLPATVATISMIWMATSLNLLGSGATTTLQSMTTGLVFIPVFGVAIFGWLYFDPAVYLAAWNVGDLTTVDAIESTLNVTLWSFIGVETAAVAAATVKDPKRNVPIATVGGVLIAAVAYVLSTTAIMGIIPNEELVVSGAPFSDAARIAFGNIGGLVVALCATAGCFGALSGWTLAVAETGRSAAVNGDFPRFYAVTNRAGAPWRGLLLTGVLQTCIVLLTVSPTAAKQFGLISSVAVVLVLVPYIYTIAGLWRFSPAVFGPAAPLWHMVAAVAFAYCVWSIISAPAREVAWCFVIVLGISVVYALHKRVARLEQAGARGEG